MRTTQHFGEGDSILRCPCCRKGNPSVALLLVLEDIRREFNAPVNITSGGRCTSHNHKVGGAKRSEHLMDDSDEFDAVDFTVTGVNARAVQRYLITCPYNSLIGVGRYKDRTHVDTRGYAARWKVS